MGSVQTTDMRTFNGFLEAAVQVEEEGDHVPNFAPRCGLRATRLSTIVEVANIAVLAASAVPRARP